jgi:predicted Zn-ribbon and HTH transcriptional regulator
MKNNIVIPVIREEDLAAANRRRETYASTRDLLATEFNDAIAKRLIAEAKHLVKCENCGKQFSADSPEVPFKCPDCK